MRFSLPSLALVAATLVLSKSINPDSSVLKPVDWAALDAATNAAAPDAGAVTNAQRLARGLPLLKPKAHRRHSQRGAPHRLGSRVQSAPRADTSPLPPITQKCNIRVASTSTDFGFISPQWNAFGEYGMFQPDQAGALEVSFSYTSDSSAQLDFTATNGPSATYPFFGAVAGFASTSDDFAAGSYNYAYVAGTTQTPAGSPPTSDPGDSSFSAASGIPENVESAVWIFDPLSKAITAQWINTDGSAPATHIVNVNDDNKALVLTGDVKAFQDTFGVPYPEVMFTCVPPVQVAQPARV